ncbi:MAG: tetratricopeptide repeat protein [Armatimonadota bacterium]|jgi:tetratricopeptide (TPR) repeat protein
MDQPFSRKAASYFDEGLAALDAGRSAEAVTAFGRTVELEPEHPDALVGLATAQAQCDDYSSALSTFERALRVAPGHAPALLGIAFTHLAAGDHEQALPVIEQALQNLPPDVGTEAHVCCAEELAEAGLLEEARDVLLKAIERHSDCAEPHFALGRIELELGQFEQAIAASKQAIALDPEWGPGQALLGTALLADEQVAKAVVAFERALALGPDDAGPRAGLSVALAEIGKGKYALGEAERAVELAPDDPDILCTVGRTHVSLRQWPEAAEVLRRAIEHDPTMPQAYLGLVEVAMGLGDDGMLREAMSGLRHAAPEMVAELEAVSAFAVPEAPAPTPRRKPRKRRSARSGDEVYQLRIDLAGFRPPIWRRVLVTSDTTLATLHWIIQVAMGWDNSHLHHFEIGGIRYSDPEFDLDFVQDETRVSLEELGLRVKSRLDYCYDFGDDWEHTIRVQKILPAKQRTGCPVCTTGRRAAPPEDCGGIGGYGAILEALRRPDDPENADLLEWVGDEYDPEAFDIESVNGRLQFLRPKPKPEKAPKQKKRRRKQER